MSNADSRARRRNEPGELENIQWRYTLDTTADRPLPWLCSCDLWSVCGVGHWTNFLIKRISQFVYPPVSSSIQPVGDNAALLHCSDCHYAHTIYSWPLRSFSSLCKVFTSLILLKPHIFPPWLGCDTWEGEIAGTFITEIMIAHFTPSRPGLVMAPQTLAKHILTIRQSSADSKPPDYWDYSLEINNLILPEHCGIQLIEWQTNW